MIAPGAGVRVYLACGVTDMRKGIAGLVAHAQSGAEAEPGLGRGVLLPGGVAASYRHSAYGFRAARIAYPWHPLFGRTLQVSPFRRGKDLTCIYTAARPDLSRELPSWMFDEGYCAGMTLGLPQVSIEGLEEFAAVLVSLGANRDRDAQSHPSTTKEKGGAVQAVSRSSPARSRAGTSTSSDAGGPERKGIGRGLGRSTAGGPGGRPRDNDGRRG